MRRRHSIKKSNRGKRSAYVGCNVATYQDTDKIGTWYYDINSNFKEASNKVYKF